MTRSLHPFETQPHRTIFNLALPALVSLVAEPVTGLVDTAFVARLGEVPLSALGVGTTALSSVFWIFSFLGISAQTGVAQADGRSNSAEAKRTVSLALALAISMSAALVLLFYPFASSVAGLMGADGAVADAAALYVRIRMFGAPAILVTMVAFGALRGRQDMRTPLWIAVGINLLNVVLDYVLIFGVGPIRPMGIEGAAIASTAAQWTGALIALYAINQRFGFTGDLNWRDARDMIRIGGDLFVRTGLLTLFLILGTRIATQGGAVNGAAHQAIRTFFVFSALFLDAFAVTAQSLVGYFIGARQQLLAKRVVLLALFWAIGASTALFVVMIVGTELIAQLLVPENAQGVFRGAWVIAAVTQVAGAAAFVTDGAHWGTGDFRYLRNSMLISTAVGIGLMLLIDPFRPNALNLIWIAIAVWTLIRTAVGLIRIWPGVGESPFAANASQ